jgi:hypothetical protein
LLIFFVNKLPFLHTKSEKLNFITAFPAPSRSEKTIINELENVIDIYTARGFKVTDCHGDNEFDTKAIKARFKKIIFHICGRNEHVNEIERSVRTVKERSRTTCHAVPYRRYTKLMTRHMVKGVIDMLNDFPSSNGVSQTLSPNTIVLGKGKPDFNKPRIAFGAYAMVYIGTTNTMKSRAIPGIALNASNDRGGHFFMSIHTGKRIHSHKWQELPISNEIIDAVEALAKKEGAKLMPKGMPLFEWAPGIEIIDEVEEDIANDDNNDVNQNNIDNEVVNFVPLDGQHVVSDDDDSIQNNDSNDDDDSNANENNNENVDENANNNNEDNTNIHAVIDIDSDDEDSDYEYKNESESDDDYYEYDETTLVRDASDGNDDVDNNEDNDDSVETTNVNAEDIIGSDNEGEVTTFVEPLSEEEARIHNEEDSSNPRRSTRSNRGQGVPTFTPRWRGKTHHTVKEIKGPGQAKPLGLQFLQQSANNQLPSDVSKDMMNRVVEITFTQMSANKGFKLFGEKAVSAIFNEFIQLDKGVQKMKSEPVVLPVAANTLTEKEKKEALPAVNLIKEKRTGELKGRTCANGSKQHLYLKEDESVASPTVSVEGLFTTMVIDAYERRDTAIFDVKGAYLHADMPPDKRVLLKLRGRFVDIMCQVNPVHKENVICENGVQVLYLWVVKALYGCIQSALLWYELYAKTLKNMALCLIHMISA